VAREACGLTQQQVADSVALPRTAIVQAEAGNRAVSSLELSHLARLFGRAIDEFVTEADFAEDPVSALFRSAPGMAEEPVLASELRRCADLCRQATRLEGVLGLATRRPLLVAYAMNAPSNRWEAVNQGRYLAESERRRLDLGTSPVWDIAEIVRQQGVRVTEYDMPDDISGLSFHSGELGLVMVVNRRHSRTRRLFSYAHEYCHLLADRGRSGTVSRHADREELIEVRANAFAAHFLMPDQGVRTFLQSLGKGEPTRQEQEIFDGVRDVPVQKRMEAGSQQLQVHDVVRLAHHFGSSYEAALYQLLNLRLLQRDRFESLKKQQDTGRSVARALRLSPLDEELHWNLTEQILALALEAYRRGEISESKLYELAEEAGTPKKELREVLRAEALVGESVEAVYPG